MTTKTRRAFTDEFKREAVLLLAGSGRPVTQVATELGVQPSMLRAWHSCRTQTQAGWMACRNRAQTEGVRLPCYAATLEQAGHPAWRRHRRHVHGRRDGGRPRPVLHQIAADTAATSGINSRWLLATVSRGRKCNYSCAQIAANQPSVVLDFATSNLLYVGWQARALHVEWADRT